MDAIEHKLTKCRISFYRHKVPGQDVSNPNLIFMSAFVSRLPCEMTKSIPKAATDGTRIVWNPEFVEKEDIQTIFFTYLHECGHVMLGHHYRRKDRDPALFNIAADLSLNYWIKEAGVPVPDWVYLPGRFPCVSYPGGLSVEQYYDILLKDPNVQKFPAAFGEVTEPGSGSPADLAEAEARTNTVIAAGEALARSMGQDSCTLSRLARQSQEKPADWRAILRRFLSTNSYDDYSWSRPNRRFIGGGLYLPGMRSEALGDVVVMVDTSGSISGRELSQFTAEIQAVLAAYPCSVHVVYHDHDVAGEECFDSNGFGIQLNAKGGGGTSHVPVFNWLAKQGKEPACVIALTDMYSRFPTSGPDCPVLWAVTGGNTYRPPFGETIQLSI